MKPSPNKAMQPTASSRNKSSVSAPTPAVTYLRLVRPMTLHSLFGALVASCSLAAAIAAPFQKPIMVATAANPEPAKSVQRPQPTPRPRPTPHIRPLTIVVTNTNDSGPGSLRQALADAGNKYKIIFSITGTIGLTSGELLVNHSINI